VSFNFRDFRSALRDLLDWFNLPLDRLRRQARAFALMRKVYAKRAALRGKQPDFQLT